MKTLHHVVCDPEGLHARTAGQLVRKIMPFQSNVTISRPDGKTSNGKRLIGVMGLAIKIGQEMTITIEGEDEESAYSEIAAFCRESV